MWMFAGRAGSPFDCAGRAVQAAGGARGDRSRGETSTQVSGPHGSVAPCGDSERVRSVSAASVTSLACGTQQAPPLSRQSHPGPGTGDCLRQQLGARLAWTLTASQPSLQTTTSKGVPSAASRNVTRPRRDGDTGGE